MENFNLEKITVQPFSTRYVEDATYMHSQVLDGWSMKSLIADLANTTTYSYVAVYEGKAVGFCSFQVVDDAELLFLCVNPQYRRLGIANSLLHNAIMALPRGISSVVLEVRSKNEPAINLYKKMGFTTLGKRKNFYSFPEDDAIVMELVKGGVKELD